ncbi:hypothetical protein [Perlabentimonas gracilis]|uniref:hypothetical protein n=1 Tax=Perlabentimonas gracilis TaxID=2715279 RepID=UPI00140DD07C|nr:hypothetical protein [Perlabentimonas gracilis]NHB69601.1 hypothetical protein [Perlabentimonas gracilis]
MNTIKEKYFVVGEDEFHTQLIIKNYGDRWSSFYKNFFGHIVYIDTELTQVVCATVFSDININSNLSSFENYLGHIKTIDFVSVLMLTTAYPRRRDLLKRAVVPAISKSSQLDMLLNDSNGWLLYNYQLEELVVMATGCTPVEAQTLRKRINQKEASAFSETESINLFGVSLKDLITERAEFSPTLYPEYRGAYLLFRHLNNCM